MAKVSNSVGNLVSGKMNKQTKEVHRVRNGHEFVHTIENPYEGPASPAQKAHRSLFGKTNALVNTILADPAQKEEWRKRMEEYNLSIDVIHPPFPKRFETVRSFVYAMIKEQFSNTPYIRRKFNNLPLTLPKGVTLHISTFADLSAAELYEILKARFAVFVMEQNIRYLDEDNIDYIATHFAIRQNGHVIAYARLFPGSEKGVLSIGRMLTTERGKGYAKYILNAIVSFARSQNAHTLRLHAQIQVVSFYEHLGFHTVGSEFMEAGRTHILMERQVD